LFSSFITEETHMPLVRGKHFPYTPAGKKAAAKAKKAKPSGKKRPGS